VLATQGRAFWIVDDLSPLRQYAASQVDADLHLYQPARAIRLTPTRGRNAGGDMFAPSAPNGALIYYALGSEPTLEEDEIVLEILDSDGNVIRRLATDVAIGNEGGGGGVTYALPAEAGLNRALWDLRTAPTAKVVNYPFLAGSGSGLPVAGYHVAPGTYRLRLTRGDTVRESAVEVAWDPINDYDPARIAEQQRAVAEAFDMLDAIYRRLAALPDLRSQVEMRRKLAEAAGDSELAESARTLLDDIDAWRDSVSTPEATNTQDVLHFPPKLEAFLANIYGIIDKAVLGLTRGQRDRLEDLRPRWEAAIDAWDQIIEERVAGFNDGAGPTMLVPDL
jgi:predicted component of type VI protein secretion system